MKISIIPDDDVVLIDFEEVHGIDVGLASDVHALQWYNDSGHIEYRNGLVENITEFPFPDLVDKFNARKAELAAPDPGPDTRTYDEKRKAEYPSIDYLVVALWEGVVEERMQAVTQVEIKRQAVKAKYPK